MSLCAVALCLALGATGACADNVTPSGAVIQTGSDHNPGRAIHDLGLAAPTTNSDDPTPTPSSAATAGSADAAPVPELPTWGMMLLCFIGLGIAGFTRSRKDRLSPGIE
jgi:hypothetical protein